MHFLIKLEDEDEHANNKNVQVITSKIYLNSNAAL